MKRFIDSIRRVKRWRPGQKPILFWTIFLLAGVLAIAIPLGYFYFGQKEGPAVSPKTTGQGQSQQIIEKPQRFLDGVFVEEGKESFRPLAVIIDNMIDSLPPSGLDKASLVYEFPVEAGITRFLAIFDPEEAPQEIGPVRSARPYMARVAEEYKPLFVHAGGSPEVVNKIAAGSYSFYNLDEISMDGSYFWRGSGRVAPHNLFTSGDNLKKALENKKITQTADFSHWQFKKEPELSLLKPGFNKTDEITINFSTYHYKVKWQYSKDDNSYSRYQRGLPYKTSAGEQIEAKNIVIQYVEVEIIDSIGRRKIDLETGGKAIIFKDGQIIQANWQKKNKRTKFFDEEDKEIQFNPGPTWIERVPSDKQVSY